MVSSENRKHVSRMHDDQSKEHDHAATNLDQSSRSERFIVEKCPMRCESIGSREFDEHSECEFFVSTIEALRKNLAPECNVKRSGGLILDTYQMTGRVSAGYRERETRLPREAHHYSSQRNQFAHCVLPARCHRWNVDLPKEFKDCTSECPRISPTV